MLKALQRGNPSWLAVSWSACELTSKPRDRVARQRQSDADMTSYCRSCFRDLPSDDAACQRCVRSAASSASPVIGLLVFALVMAGMLTFDARLSIAAAAIAIAAIAIQIARVIN